MRFTSPPWGGRTDEKESFVFKKINPQPPSSSIQFEVALSQYLFLINPVCPLHNRVCLYNKLAVAWFLGCFPSFFRIGIKRFLSITSAAREGESNGDNIREIFG